MSEERKVKLQFSTPAEKIEFDQALARCPTGRHWLTVGVETAEKQSVPVILRGGFGFMADEIDRNIVRVSKAGESALREPPNPLTRDEILCYRGGLRGTMRMAAEAVSIARQADNGMALLRAGIEALSGAQLRASLIAPETAPPLPAPTAAQALPHALALGSRPPRPLRPEDFGALPPARPRA